MKRDDFTMPLGFADELIIANFAGGGGTSTGLQAAFCSPVYIKADWPRICGYLGQRPQRAHPER